MQQPFRILEALVFPYSLAVGAGFGRWWAFVWIASNALISVDMWLLAGQHLRGTVANVPVFRVFTFRKSNKNIQDERSLDVYFHPQI